jgi:hypothetical protein
MTITKGIIATTIVAFVASIATLLPKTIEVKSIELPPAEVQTIAPTLLPELYPICSCESVGNPNGPPTHYDKDGNVLRGKLNPSDLGLCQINLFYHGDRAKKLGIDLFSESGNIEYANLLYSENGTRDWNWSKHCWSTGDKN